jgi:hypothetical protein
MVDFMKINFKKIGKIFIAVFLILYILVNEVFASAYLDTDIPPEVPFVIFAATFVFGITIGVVPIIIADLFQLKKLKTIGINIISFFILILSISFIIIQFTMYNHALEELNEFFVTYNSILGKIIGIILIANVIFLFFKKHNTLKDIAITYFCFSFITFAIIFIGSMEIELTGNVYLSLVTIVVLLAITAVLNKDRIIEIKPNKE